MNNQEWILNPKFKQTHNTTFDLNILYFVGIKQFQKNEIFWTWIRDQRGVWAQNKRDMSLIIWLTEDDQVRVYACRWSWFFAFLGIPYPCYTRILYTSVI